MTDARTVYVTAATEEQARTLASELLERRLIACANLLPGMRSLYRWQGRIEDDAEVAMLLKTQVDRLPELIRAVEELHPYDTPCVVAWPIEAGSEAYLGWIEDETRAAPSSV